MVANPKAIHTQRNIPGANKAAFNGLADGSPHEGGLQLAAITSGAPAYFVVLKVCKLRHWRKTENSSSARAPDCEAKSRAVKSMRLFFKDVLWSSLGNTLHFHNASRGARCLLQGRQKESR